MSNKESSDAADKVPKAADRKSSAVRRVAQAADTGEKRDRAMSTRLGFPAIVGLVTLLGLLLVIYAWTDRDPAQKPEIGDHWHSVYGVFDCSLNGGEGGYLPAFLSQVDPDGIHSHQDAIMHIHPWADRSDGPDAQIHVFLEAMQVELTDSRLVLDSGRILEEGTDCNGEPAILQVLRWDFAFQAEADNPPQVFTDGLADIAFQNDREAYVIAFAPAGAEIPKLPAERFAQIQAVAPVIQSAGPVAQQEQTFNVPETSEEPEATEDGG